MCILTRNIILIYYKNIKESIENIKLTITQNKEILDIMNVIDKRTKQVIIKIKCKCKINTKI